MERAVKESDVPMLELTSDEMKDKYLTFYLGSQLYGVAIADVVQIIGMKEITEMPEYPAYAKGVIMVRDSVIPLIDVRLRLGKEARPYDEKTCIIISAIQDRTLGFIVDEVDAVCVISEDQISPPPDILGSQTEQTYLVGVACIQGDKTVLILDCAGIVPSSVLMNL